MTRRGCLSAVLAMSAAGMLAGCVVSPPEERERATIAIVCGSTPAVTEVFVGETVQVTRGPDGPCDGLGVGRKQFFTFRSSNVYSSVGATAYVEIADDGSVSFELVVPADMRLGTAKLEAVPRVNPCDDDAMLDCPPPSATVTVSHRPSALRTVSPVSSGLEPSPLPERLGDRAYVLRGPAPDEVTVVLRDSRCETIPTAFVSTAPRDSLELVSGPRTGGKCQGVPSPWTSIIEVPAAYAGFTSVKVDNVPAELHSAPPDE
jgi:hypothetical protein